jgi:hypothetical protein
MVDAKILGMEFLRSIVPYADGWLYSTITGEVKKQSDGSNMKIEFRPDIMPNSKRSPKGNYGNYPTFSLVQWAAQSEKAEHHFQNGGDPRWMKRTRTYLKSKVGDKVKQDYKKLRL